MDTNNNAGTVNEAFGDLAEAQQREAKTAAAVSDSHAPATPDATLSVSEMPAPNHGGPANLRTGASIAPARALKADEWLITLPSGSVAIMGKTYGKNVRIASRICDGDADMYGVAMLCTCTEVDGQGLTPHAFDALPAKDAEALMGEYNEKNG